nr:MAG TPA: hypothetical protein [Caudoviricetes sp.]
MHEPERSAVRRMGRRRTADIARRCRTSDSGNKKCGYA